MLVMMRNLPKDAVCSSMASVIGELTLIASSKGLHAVLDEKDLADKECKQIVTGLKKSNKFEIIVEAKQQLREYFSKKRNKFNIKLSLDGTPFQVSAWKELLKIPYGKTITYGQQAEKMGDKKLARAVGGANGRNPLGIIIPCHRVIGQSGALTGFRGGVDKKKYLLNLETQV